jgi:hypothetical protein
MIIPPDESVVRGIVARASDRAQAAERKIRVDLRAKRA